MAWRKADDGVGDLISISRDGTATAPAPEYRYRNFDYGGMPSSSLLTLEIAAVAPDSLALWEQVEQRSSAR